MWVRLQLLLQDVRLDLIHINLNRTGESKPEEASQQLWVTVHVEAHLSENKHQNTSHHTNWTRSVSAEQERLFSDQIYVLKHNQETGFTEDIFKSLTEHLDHVCDILNLFFLYFLFSNNHVVICSLDSDQQIDLWPASWRFSPPSLTVSGGQVTSKM